ncbi:peptide-methionine (S)-S-oxide reductase MsrA [Parvularcula lutaonensis]|uniref:Peptide methionine sulfoxide reductase MsrA n=1 Tax=Parvularcula lutaonensis TaxID=491923 RepID=A0ABV7MGW8_9PROT|nr:peptide-methionine (S)-S-oxide reductase MsrA [Parvularcula lutaonensis]GGY55103.1 peptide methionine sulfoxide reductase MsrA [Parvularcula lutaonensis]
MTETKTAVLAGGCFWGMEELIRHQPGVVSTRVGYTGGTLDKPTYNDVKTGKTGHAEAIEIVYDPSVMSYEKLLQWFFQIHDPTTKDRQGNDIGTQYRSAIWYQDQEQKETAEKVIAAVEASGKWPGRVVTEVAPAQTFWEAEEFHQDYLQKYPNGYTCHYVRPDWTLDGAAA